MSHFTTFAIPKMLARLPDVVSRTTRFVRAIPAMRIRCGTNVICRVVFVFRRTIPKMGTVFVRRETGGIRCTITIAAARAVCRRGRVFVCASRTIPVMTTSGIGILNRQAVFAEPVAVAGCVICVPIGVRCTPPLVGTMLFRRINTIATVFAAPTILVGAGRRLQMAVAMSRMVVIDVTIPGMRTGRLIQRIIRTPTAVFFAIPITFSAGFRERMPFIALRAIPAVLAVWIRLGRVMCQMIGTVPTMFTACGCGVHTRAIGTIPAVILWAIGTDGMVGRAGCTPPVMTAIFFSFQNFLAICAISPAARADFI